jgi:hypothetical protein
MLSPFDCVTLEIFISANKTYLLYFFDWYKEVRNEVFGRSEA